MLVILDVSGIVYRSFYGIPPVYTSDGVQKNAVVGFHRKVQHLTRTFPDATFLACFDTSRDTNIRCIENPSYKANRKASPEGLHEQFDLVRRLCDAMAIQMLYTSGYEADDLIASICENTTDRCVVVTYDKDMLQLLRHAHVTVYNPQLKQSLDDAYVYEKYGVHAVHFDLYLALVGDAADNVKGIHRIGPKRAKKLISDTDGQIDILSARLNEDIHAHLRMVRFMPCDVHYERNVPVKMPQGYDAFLT